VSGGQEDAGGSAGTPLAGLGQAAVGSPDFRSGDPLPPPPPPSWHQPASAPGRPSAGPPPANRPSRLPAVLTVAVLALVLGAVVAGTAVARYADTHVAAAPVRRTAPRDPQPSDPDGLGGIDFAAAGGRGRLVVLARTWSETAPARPPGRRHLRIHLELVCTGGHVTHAPEYFSLFDEGGRLVEGSLAVVEPDPVPLGVLGPGERVRGHVGFDLPRGAVTLVMSNGVSSVAALRLPG
jgi:hypothetical protein